MMNLFKTAAMYSAIDEESQAYTLKTCPWGTAKYHRYGKHMAVQPYIKDAKSCIDINALRAIIADLDNNLVLDKCEMSLMCIGTKAFGSANPKTKKDWEGVAKKCIQHMKPVKWSDIVKACKTHKWTMEQQEVEEMDFDLANLAMDGWNEEAEPIVQAEGIETNMGGLF